MLSSRCSTWAFSPGHIWIADGRAQLVVPEHPVEHSEEQAGRWPGRRTSGSWRTARRPAGWNGPRSRSGPGGCRRGSGEGRASSRRRRRVRACPPRSRSRPGRGRRSPPRRWHPPWWSSRRNPRLRLPSRALVGEPTKVRNGERGGSRVEDVGVGDGPPTGSDQAVRRAGARCTSAEPSRSHRPGPCGSSASWHDRQHRSVHRPGRIEPDRARLQGWRFPDRHPLLRLHHYERRRDRARQLPRRSLGTGRGS